MILFTCGATRAVHLEVAEDCSAEAFAGCFLRFTARRGRPKVMVLDNGMGSKHFSADLLKPWEPGKIEGVALTLLKGGLASQGVRDNSRESVREPGG